MKKKGIEWMTGTKIKIKSRLRNSETFTRDILVICITCNFKERLQNRETSIVDQQLNAIYLAKN